MKTQTKKRKTPKARSSSETGAAGTYVYDKELGRVVRISDRIPGLSRRGRASAEPGPCGRQACAGGVCAGPGGSDD